MIRPSDLENTMVDPDDLTSRDAAPDGEHEERPRPPCSHQPEQTNSRGDKLTPAHEWREDVCQDGDDDEAEAS